MMERDVYNMESLVKLRENLSKSLTYNKRNIERINELNDTANSAITIIKKIIDDIKNKDYDSLIKDIDEFLTVSAGFSTSVALSKTAKMTSPDRSCV